MMEELAKLLDLNKSAEDIKTQLYWAQCEALALTQDDSNIKCPFLIDIKWLKLRVKTEKKFPQLPELTKIPNISEFIDKSHEVIATLHPLVKVVNDTMTFQHNSMTLLFNKDILNSLNVNYPSRVIADAWILAFINYIKVIYLLDMIPEKFNIIPIYFLARNVYSKNADGNNFIEEHLHSVSAFKACLSGISDVLQHLMDCFMTTFESLSLLVIKVAGPLIHWWADSNNFRVSEVFDPFVAIQTIKVPCYGFRSLYAETLQLPLYCDFACLAAICCPRLLYSPEAFAVVSAICENRLVLSIFRDLTLNIHLELEKVSNIFPRTVDSLNFKVPRGIKLATQLKHLSRHSVSICPSNQKLRRKLLRDSVLAQLRLLSAVPGSIAVVFWRLLSSSAWLKLEILSYFDHLSPVACRKDSIGNYDAAAFVGNDISSALHAVYQSQTAILSGASIITEYYKESILLLRLPRLKEMLCDDEINKQCLESIEALDSLDSQNKSHMCNLASSFCCKVLNSTTCDADAIYELVALLSDLSIFEDISGIVKSHIDPHICGFQREALVRSVTLSLSVATDSKPSISADIVHLAFLGPLLTDSLKLNLTVNVPQEIRAIASGAVATVGEILLRVCSNVVDSIRQYGEHLALLEAQVLPFAAARRILTKARALPGYESETYMRSAVAKFAMLKLNLREICRAVGRKGTLGVFQKIFDLRLMLRQRIEAQVLVYCRALFRSNSPDKNGDDGSINLDPDFGASLRRMLGLLRASNEALDCIGSPSGEASSGEGPAGLLRRLRVSEGYDPALDCPILIKGKYSGNNNDAYDDIAIEDLKDDDEDEPIVAAVSRFFSQFVTHVVCGKSPIFIYAPTRCAFEILPAKKEDKDPEASNSTNDYFGLSESDIIPLLSIVGLQGAAVIESTLLSRFYKHLFRLLSILRDIKSPLLALDRDYIFAGATSTSSLPQMPQVLQEMRAIGVILVIREMLSRARRTTSQAANKDLHDSMNAFNKATFALNTTDTAAEGGVAWRSVSHALGLDSRTGNILDDSLACDISLLDALGAKFLEEERDSDDLEAMWNDFLTLLPLSVAAMMSSEAVKASVFLPVLNSFADNEHLIILSLAVILKISKAFLKKHEKSLEESEEEPVDVTLRVGAQSLISLRLEALMRLQRGLLVARCPYNALVLLLSSIGGHKLEEYLPYDVVQSCRIDIALGAQTITDTPSGSFVRDDRQRESFLQDESEDELEESLLINEDQGTPK